MTTHTFDVSAKASGVNAIELLAAIKAADAAAEMSMIRGSDGTAQSLSIQTNSAVPRATFQSVLNSHVPTKTEAESAAQANETAFRGQVSTKLADTDFKSFVETELSKLGGK